MYTTIQKDLIIFQNINTLLSKCVLNWSKVTVKTFFILMFYFKWKFTKILSSTTVFNIDNNNACFLSSKSAY